MIFTDLTHSERKRRKEGKIIKIISHEITEVVGLFEKAKTLDMY